MVAAISPQVDRLYVFLNGYGVVPEFLNRENVTVFTSEEFGDQHDRGKFFALKQCHQGIYVAIDDDIRYPKNYVRTLVGKIEYYDYKAVVGVHGAIYPEWPSSFFDRGVLHFSAEMERDLPCSILGTGTVAVCLDTVPLRHEIFESPGMADIWLARFLKARAIPISVARRASWLKDINDDAASSIFDRTRTDSSAQDDAIGSSAPWGVDDILARSDAIADRIGTPVMLGLRMASLARQEEPRLTDVLAGFQPQGMDIQAAFDTARRYVDPFRSARFMLALVDRAEEGSPLWLAAIREMSSLWPEQAAQLLDGRLPDASLRGDAGILLVNSLMALPDSERAMNAAERTLAHAEDAHAAARIAAVWLRARYARGDYIEVVSLADRLLDERQRKTAANLCTLILTNLHLGNFPAVERLLVALFSIRRTIRERDLDYLVREFALAPASKRRSVDMGAVLSALVLAGAHKRMRPATRIALAKIVVEGERRSLMDMLKIEFLNGEVVPGDDRLMLAYLADTSMRQEFWLNEVLSEQGYAPIPPGGTGPHAYFERVVRAGRGLDAVEATARISVIMTAFNAENTVDLAIESILGQTYRNLELIVVDDQSTDRTWRCLEAWTKRDDRVVTLRSLQNSGPYACRNLALRHASGVLIAIQDADDVSHPQRLAKQAAALSPAAVGCIARHVRIDSAGRLRLENDSSLLGHGPMTLIFRRSVLAEVGEFDNVRTRGDLEFIARLNAHYGRSAIVNRRDLVLFALHDAGSNSFVAIDSEAKRRALREYKRTYTERNLVIARKRAERLREAARG